MLSKTKCSMFIVKKHLNSMEVGVENKVRISKASQFARLVNLNLAVFGKCLIFQNAIS